MADLMIRRALLAVALLLAAAVPTVAQQRESEFASWRVPGWSFTPGLSIGLVRDTNVALAAPGENAKADADSLFGIEPFGSLELVTARTEFSAGYRGYLRRYMEIEELNGFDQRAEVRLQRLVTRRLTIFLRDDYVNVPTTDEVQLNGLPFLRSGARMNVFGAGFEARLTKFTNLSSHYELTWVDFDNKGTVLTGGWLNSLRTDVRHRFTARTTAGAEYSIRFADLNEGTRSLTFHDAGGVLTFAMGPHTTISAAAGISRLEDDLQKDTRTAPYFRGELVHGLEAATVGVTYERSFIPSFGFGGSSESQELRGFVRMPIPSNRAYVEVAAAWRHSVPLIATDLELDSFVTRATVGYALARWFRVEGFHAYTRQDSKVTGGEIDRQRLGVQMVISQPMRIQ